jgi:ubiquinone biosynthesis protein Coq4
MVTGFGTNSAGEQALSICNTVSGAAYFTPALAQMLSHTTLFVSAAGYMRTALHYPALLPAYAEAMRQGIAMGQALKRPLFMEPWEEYLDWTVEEIAVHLGIERGPDHAWDWTSEAGSG